MRKFIKSSHNLKKKITWKLSPTHCILQNLGIHIKDTSDGVTNHKKRKSSRQQFKNMMCSIPNLSILKGPCYALKANYLHRIFEEIVTKHSNDNALLYEVDGHICTHTYEELNERTNRMARYIIKIIQRDELTPNFDGDYIIAVCMEPTDHLIITLLSIWKAGAAYLPLDPVFPAARIEHIISDSKPVIVFYEHDSVSFTNTKKISLQELNAAITDDLPSNNLREEECLKHILDDLAIVLYTSGSTGVPKGVRLPHNVILNRLRWQFRTFPYSITENVCIVKTALTFGDSIAEIWGPLLNGLSILIVPVSTTKDPEKLIATLDDNKIERLTLVPSLLGSLLTYIDNQKGKIVLRNLKIWVCSGETLPVSLAKKFFKYFPENEHILCNFYGSTEIMGDVSYHIIKNVQQLKYEEKVPIGVPIDNTILYLLDKNYSPVKAGDVGELYVSGLNLAAGYVNGRDTEKFLENPLAIDPIFSRLFRTGDFGRVEKGSLQFEGRTDSQVKIRGRRVDLLEVEMEICSIPGIDKSVVLCSQPGDMNQALLAFVTSTNLMSENQIEDILRHKLPSYMLPQVILMESIPLLGSGKVDRQALLKTYDSCFEAEIDYTGVQTDQMIAAKVLFETVAAVLSRSARAAINIKAIFYAIGGNSLNSISTIASLNDKGYYISISDFIAAKDLGEVLGKICSEKTNLTINTRQPIYKMEILTDKHKIDVLNLLTTTVCDKGDLEQWLLSDMCGSVNTEYMDQVWPPLVDQRLSFVCISEENNKVIGASLNFDAHDKPKLKLTSNIRFITDFVEAIEGPIRDEHLNAKRDVLEAYLVATHSSLSSKENIALVQYMEAEVIKIAKMGKFAGILSCNVNALTQQLASSVFGYETMVDYQVNKYVARDGSKPFGMAPDSQRLIVHWKRI